MFFNEDHLRVIKVRTADGSTPFMDPVTEKTLKKIVLMPDNPTTRRLLDEQNNLLPTPLKMKIERIPAYKPVPVIQENKNEKTEVLTLKNLELETEVEKLKEQLAKALEFQHPAKVQDPGNGSSSNGTVTQEAVKETVTAETKNKR